MLHNNLSPQGFIATVYILLQSIHSKQIISCLILVFGYEHINI